MYKAGRYPLQKMSRWSFMFRNDLRSMSQRLERILRERRESTERNTRAQFTHREGNFTFFYNNYSYLQSYIIRFQFHPCLGKGICKFVTCFIFGKKKPNYKSNLQSLKTRVGLNSPRFRRRTVKQIIYPQISPFQQGTALQRDFLLFKYFFFFHAPL